MISTVKKILNDYRNNKIIEIQYIIGLLLITLKTTCNNSELIDLSNISSYLYIIAFLMMIPKVVFQKYTTKQLIFSLIFLLFNILFVIASNTKNLILISLLLIGIKDSDIKKIIKYIFIITTIVIVMHASIYIYQCILDGYKIFEIFTFDREVHRGTVLYKSNNNFAMLTACSILQYIYITNRKSKKIIKVLILFAYSIFVYSLGQSKASLIVSILLILYFILDDSKFILKYSKIIKNCSIVTSLLFSLFILVVDVNSKLGSFLNKCLTGRITLEQKFYKLVGLNLFPQIENYDELVTWHIDNLYISYLLKWGILLSILTLVLIVFLTSNKNNKEIDNIYVSIIFIWGIVENTPKLLTITIISLILFNNFYNCEKYIKND